jgi:glycosyltransferase involved in cell wall biosynthesis
MEQNKHVLIIADLGHASPRIPGLCRFLPENGWDYTIITPRMTASQRAGFIPEQAGKLNILETQGYPMYYGGEIKRPFLSRIFRQAFLRLGLSEFFVRLVDYPDRDRSWKLSAVALAVKTISQKHIDLIFSTSSPVTAHLIAARLKKKFLLPWVADLRDLWTQNHNYPYNERRRRKEKLLEKKTLDNTDMLTTVTTPLIGRLASQHGDKVRYIPNGFFPDLENSSPSEQQFEKFTILYSGQIYPGKQNACIFLDAMNLFLSEIDKSSRDNIQLLYYGVSGDFLHTLIEEKYKNSPVASVTNLGGQLPRNEIYRIQKRAHILLIFKWEDATEKGIAFTKLYEYMRTGNPIIATGGHNGDYVHEVLTDTKAGVTCVTTRDAYSAVVDFYGKYQCNDIDSSQEQKSAVLEYSYPSAAKKLAGIFNEVI